MPYCETVLRMRMQIRIRIQVPKMMRIQIRYRNFLHIHRMVFSGVLLSFGCTKTEGVNMSRAAF